MHGDGPDGWADEDIHAAETVPMARLSGRPARPHSRRAPRVPWPATWDVRLSRPQRPIVLALVLAAVLAAGSGALALAATHPWALPRGSAAALVVPTQTATATPTLAPTTTATPRPAATAITSWPTGGIDLGCGSTALHPPTYVVRTGVTSPPAVALTFDDGPSPDWTATILDTLEQTHTPATFFVVGASAKAYPNLIQREAADGFAIAMHTWDHPYMTQLSVDARAWELAHTAQAIHADLGANYCLPYWRPPFGDYNAAVLAQAHAMGLTTVTWDVDPADWSSPGVQAIADRVLSHAHPGAIILLHDGYFHRGETAHALPLIIQGLHDRGFTPVTLPQLLSGQIPSAPSAPAPPGPTATTAPPSPTAVPPTATLTSPSPTASP